MLSVSLLLCTGMAGLPAHAVNFDWNAAAGDWFAAANWVSDPAGTAGPPGINDNASIYNGGTAQVNGGTLETTRIHVGSTSIINGGPSTPNDLKGALTLNNASMDLNQLLWIGVMKGANATTGRSATGVVTTTGANPIDTSVTGVGVAESTAGAVTVKGELNVAGPLSGFFSGFGTGVGVALNAGSSEADGKVVANSGADVTLGLIGFANESGTAKGSFIVTNGDLTLPESAQYQIGRASGSGVATGHLEVSNGAILTPGLPGNVFGNTFNIGETFLPNGAGDLPEATGTLIARNGPSTALGTTNIGTTFGGGIAKGTVTITNGGLSMDDPSGTVGEWDMRVGASFGGSVNRAGSATGVLNLNGLLRGAADNDSFTLGSGGSLLDIGAVFNGALANADGTVTASGVDKFNLVRVGYAENGVAGTTAKGRLFVGSDGITGNGDFFSDLFIGSSLSDGDADGEIRVTGGDVDNIGGSVYVGYATDDGSARGTLAVDGGDLLTPRSLLVGVADAADTETPTAEGHFFQSGGSLTMTDFSSLAIGLARVNSGSDGQAQASGTATLTGVTGQTSTLSVGTTQAAGGSQQLAEATGTLNLVNSNLTATSGASVGVASFGFSGVNKATGILNLTDSELVIGPNSGFPGQATLAVGVANGVVAQADGQVTLTRSHISAERLNLGGGSHLIFDIEGLTRVSQYGAIDIAGCVGLNSADCSIDNPGFANLAGTAEIRFDTLFDFDAALGQVFDLIVATSFSFENFQGGLVDTFFDSVAFSGLNPGYVANAFIFDGGDHEIFRVALARQVVPEPGVPLLLAAGLVLALTRLRRQR